MYPIILNGRSIPLENIIRGQVSHLAQDPYEKKVLEFCSTWIKKPDFLQVSTSGSTGKPKTVNISREQILHSVGATQKKLKLQKDDHALACLDVEYIGGKMMLIRALEIGMRLTILSPASDPFKEVRLERPIDFIALVPLQLHTILESVQRDLLDSCKAILVGGAPLSLTLEKSLVNCRAPIYSAYGMTETVSHIALRRLNGPQQKDYFEILEEAEIGVDESQCLWVKSPVTNQQLVQTNDMVELIDAQKFVWKGRKDHVINSGGIKIHPESIEKELEEIWSELDLEVRFFVGGLTHSTLGEMVCLILEGTSIPQPIEEQLRYQMVSRLTKYEVPKSIFYVDRFIETPTGKIKRKAILEQIMVDRL